MRTMTIATAAVLMLGVPAQAHVGPDATRVAFGITVPCAVACAYWVDNGFTPCENPFPPGSYDDRLTDPTPPRPVGKIAVLEVTLDAEIDHDLFLCRNDATRLELAQGISCGWSLTSCAPGPCDDPTGITCYRHEDASTPIAEGKSVIIRAYNWSDPATATGHYWWVMV